MPGEQPSLIDDGSWQEFEHKLRIFARRRVGPDDADDIVSEILMRLVRSEEKLASARSPLAWVYGVASHVVSDHFRQKKRDKLVLRELAHAGEFSGQFPDAVEAEVSGNLSLCMKPLISTLPPAYAEALQKTDIEGMRQADAAKQLQLSLPALKSRVRRGRERLKHALLRCCDVKTGRRGEILDYKPRQSGSACKPC